MEDHVGNPDGEMCSYSGGMCILYNTYCGPRKTCVFGNLDLPEDQKDEGLERYRTARQNYLERSRPNSGDDITGSDPEYLGRRLGPGDNN